MMTEILIVLQVMGPVPMLWTQETQYTYMQLNDEIWIRR